MSAWEAVWSQFTPTQWVVIIPAALIGFAIFVALRNWAAEDDGFFEGIPWGLFGGLVLLVFFLVLIGIISLVQWLWTAT